MDDDESITLDGRAFVWVKTRYNLNGTWAKLYLTNKRFYARDRLIRLKLMDIPFSEIRDVVSDEKHLTISGERKGKHFSIRIRLKDIDDTWEWMLRQKMGK